MKRILVPSILFFLAVVVGYSQNAPQKFNYQAVARKSYNTFNANAPVNVGITLSDNSGKTYTETHSKITNPYGLFSLEIGGGNSPTGSFSGLNWAGGNVTIAITVDGTSIGGAQLLSVPYALYANAAGSGTTSTLDSTKYVRLNTNPTISGNYILVWNAATSSWTVAAAPSGTTNFTGKHGVLVNGISITAKTDGTTIDTTLSGQLAVIKVPSSLLDSVPLSKIGHAGALDGYVVKYDATTKTWKPLPDATGSAGGGITSINNFNQSTQLFSAGAFPNDTTTKPQVYSTSVAGVATHIIKLPVVGKTGVPYGLLSSTDYNAFKTGIGSASSPVTVGNGLKISGNKITLKIAKSLDTTGGLLRVRRIDSMDIGTQADNYILKVKGGKLTFVPDSNNTSQWTNTTSTAPAGIFYNAGNVAIGSNTVGATYKLEVIGKTALNNLYVGGPITVDSLADLKLLKFRGTASTIKIGQVLTSIDALGNVAWADAGTASGWGLNGNDPSKLTGANFIGTTAGAGASSLRIKTNGVQRAIIDSTGRIGIYGGLNIDYGNSNKDFYTHNSGGSYLTFGNSNSGEGISSLRDLSAPNGNIYGIDIFTNNETRFSVTQQGLVGISVMKPTYVLEVGTTSTFLSNMGRHNVRFQTYGNRGDRVLYVDNAGVVRDTLFGGGASYTSGSGIKIVGNQIRANVDTSTIGTVNAGANLGKLQVMDGGISKAKLALNSVDSTKINDGGIALADLNVSGTKSDGLVLKIVNGKLAYGSDLIGSSGGGITSLNGSTVDPQTFVVGTTGVSFNILTTASSGIHSFNIPLASTASVTAGLLSNTDYAAFNSKIGTSYPLSGGDLTGTIASPVVAKIQTVPVSTIAPTANQVLQYNSITSSWVPTTIALGVGTVTSVSAAAGTPLSVSSPSTTPVISIAKANGSTDGYLISADWNTFSAKMTNPITSSNDLVYGGNSGIPTRLAAGGNGTVLTISSTGVLGWQVPTGGVAYTNGSGVYINGLNKVSANPDGITLDTLGTGGKLQIAANGVTSAKIVDGTITKADLLANTIDSTVIGAIGYSDIPTYSAGIGQVLAFNGTSWRPSNVLGDNLGNHMAAQKLDLATFTLVGMGGTSGISIDNLGNVGIQVAPNASYALNVAGKIKTSNITESSDIRFKKNIQPIANALDKVQRLTGVSYNWRRSEFPEMNFEKGTDLGLIAQEVEKVLPELVNTDDKGYKSVEYSHLVSVLVEAIKEQQKQINVLKAEASAKDSKAQNSENRIHTLEDSVSTLSTQMQLLLELVGKNEGVKAGK